MKKLSGWARSRSRRRSSQGKDAENRGSKENISSPNGKAVSSEAPPPVPTIPQEYRTGRTVEDSHARPGSSNKIKPMFIGVSRPSVTSSRPGTSGSLQNAVTSAADKVASSTPSDYQRGHTRTKSPRYVDIFSISNPKATIRTYNEDIAERNLDTNIVTKDVAKHGYVPSSKYQEEVAARNAAPPMRPSMEQPRVSSSDGYRPNYAELRARGAPREYEVQGRLANDEDIRKFHDAEKAAQYEYRRRRQLLGEAVPSTMMPGVAHSDERPQGSRADVTRQTLRSGVRQADQPVFQQQYPVIPYSGQPADEQLHRNQESRPLSASQTVHTGVIPAGNLPGYQVSRSELSQPREADTLSMSHQSAGDRPALHDRAPSSLSTASSVRRSINLSSRTIMDLTGNDSDIFSDGYPESYMSRSPHLEEARQNSYIKMQPSVVNPFTTVEHFPETMYMGQDGDVTPRPSTAIAENDHSPEPVMQYPPLSTFSPINTLASFEPKGNQDVKRTAVSNPKSVPLAKETRKPAQNKLYTVAETEPELEDYGATTGAVKARPRPSKPSTDAATSEPDGFFASIVDRHDFATGQKGLEQKAIVPPSPATSLRSSTQSDFGQSTPNRIQMSPESLHSSDFINPSTSFGVRTRDFAVTPSRGVSQSVPPNRSDREPNTSAKVTSSLRSRSVSAVPNGELIRPAAMEESGVPKYSSDFNEAEFKRKQQQARAALIKLQQSLNEEYTATSRDARKAQPRPNGVRRHANSNVSSDGRPYAPPPASIATQVRDYSRPATSQVNGYPESRDTSRPRTAFSVHEQVTHPVFVGPASGPTVKPSRHQPSPNQDSRDMVRRSSKGKEKELSNHLTEMQRLAYEMKATKIAMPTPSQQRIYEDAVSPLPRSPGEISLSSFPVPSPSHSRQTSTVSNNVGGASYQHTSSTYPSVSRAAAAPSPVVSPTPTSPDAQHRPYLSRRGSNKSQASVMTSTSQHSIPFHLIPDRGSSMRDSLVREEELEA